MKHLLLAAVAAITLATSAQAFDQKVDQMIDTERQLNGVCRDKPGDSPEGKAACAKRDELYQQLTAAGMCWGRPGEVEAQKEWRECKPQSAPATGALPTHATDQPPVGPSFSCDLPVVANQPLAQAICMDPGIARAELHYVMAYQALSQVENPASIRDDANALVGQINDACGLPVTGHLNRLSSAQQACITGKFEGERGRLLLRLRGDALNEAQLMPEQAMDIQRTLKVEGHLGPNDAVDGVFGPATRVAIRNWQRAHGQPETGFGSAAILTGTLVTAPTAAPSLTELANNATPAQSLIERGTAPTKMPEPASTNSQVAVLGLTCEATSAGPRVQGELKNLTSHPLDLVEITGTFRDRTDGFVSSVSSYAKFRPLLPGQTSPFSVWGSSNPAIVKATIVVREDKEGSLTFSGPMSVTCPPEKA